MLSFVDRLTNGWRLAVQSWRVLMQEKSLLLFPILSGISCLLVMATFAVPLWGTETARQWVQERDFASSPLAWALLFVFYFLNYFVIVYFNSALVACALVRFQGGDPTVNDGLRVASARLPQILAWALLSATVGMVIKGIENRSEKVGQLVGNLVGMAWSLSTYFIVPILVVERKNPFAAISRSLGLLRKTWGESLSGNFSIGLIGGVASLAGVVPIVLGGMAISSGMIAVGAAAIALGVAWLLVVALISTTLDSILVAALYLYASTGQAPTQFDEAVLADSFAGKPAM